MHATAKGDVAKHRAVPMTPLGLTEWSHTQLPTISKQNFLKRQYCIVACHVWSAFCVLLKLAQEETATLVQHSMANLPQRYTRLGPFNQQASVLQKTQPPGIPPVSEHCLPAADHGTHIQGFPPDSPPLYWTPTMFGRGAYPAAVIEPKFITAEQVFQVFKVEYPKSSIGTSNDQQPMVWMVDPGGRIMVSKVKTCYKLRLGDTSPAEAHFKEAHWNLQEELDFDTWWEQRWNLQEARDLETQQEQRWNQRWNLQEDRDRAMPKRMPKRHSRSRSRPPTPQRP